MDGDRDVLQLTDRLRHGRTIHRQGRLGRHAAFAYSQSDLCGRGSGAVIGDGDLAGIGPGGEPCDGLDGPGGIGRAGGNIRAAGGVDGKVLRVDADIGNGGSHVARVLNGDGGGAGRAALGHGAKVHLAHGQAGSAGGGGNGEGHVRLRGLAVVIGQHQRRAIGARLLPQHGNHGIGGAVRRAGLDGRCTAAQGEARRILAGERGAGDVYVGRAGVGDGEGLFGHRLIVLLHRIKDQVANDQLGGGRGSRSLDHEGHGGGDGLAAVIGYGDGRAVGAGGKSRRGLDGPRGIRGAGGNLRAAVGVDDKPGRIAGGDPGDGSAGAAGVGDAQGRCGGLLIALDDLGKRGYDQPEHGSLDHDGCRLAGGVAAGVGAGARHGDAQLVALILGRDGVAGGGRAGDGRAVTLPLIGHGGLRRAGHGGQLVAHGRRGARGGIGIVADDHVGDRPGGAHGGGQTAALGAAVDARAGHDQFDLLADVIGGDGVGGRVAHLVATDLPGIDDLGLGRGEGGAEHVAHDRRDGVELHIRDHGVAHHGVGRRAGDGALVGTRARHAELDGLAHVVGVHGIGGVGALEHAAHEPFIAHGGGAGRYGLHRQHAAHHGHIVVEGNAGDLVVLVVDEELVHHPTHAAAHADAVPHGALLQHGHLGAHAVDADLGIALAGAGAQAHAVAVAAPDGGVAKHIAVIGIVASEVQELAHHIADGAADADAGPVRAALQHRHRRAHRVGADDAIARARAGAQAHAVAVVAGHVGGALAGDGTADAQVIAVHIAGTAVRSLYLVPASAGAQDLDLGPGIIAGDGGRAKIRRGAQPQPAANDGAVGRRHGGRGQDAQEHHRDQKDRKKPFHLLLPPIFRLPGVVTIIIRTSRTKSSLLWNFIVQ